jgi:hypothetical protein
MFNLDCLQAALRPDERLEVHVRRAARVLVSAPPLEDIVQVDVFAVSRHGAQRTLISTQCPVAPEARP